MTKEQFEKYEQIEDELKPIKIFLSLCGRKYHDKYASNYLSRLRYYKVPKFKIYPKHHTLGESVTFDIPKELHDRIIDVIEQYVDEKEKEKEAL